MSTDGAGVATTKKKPRTFRSDARSAPGVEAAIKALAARVRELREAAALTQEEVASLARLDGKHLQLIEAGKTNPTLATLVGVARALGVSVVDLFSP